MSKICRKEGLELKKKSSRISSDGTSSDCGTGTFCVSSFQRGIYLSFLNYNLVRPNDPHLIPLQDYKNYIDIFKDKVFHTVYWKYSKVDSGESCGTACGSHASCTCTEPETERKICIQNLILVPWAVPHAIAAMTFTFFIQCKCRYH